MNILIVDDQPLFLEILTKQLKRLGHTVISVEGPDIALEKLARPSHQIDLILTDLHMPVMEGTEMIEKIRKQNIRIPIVLMTGYFLELDESIYERMARSDVHCLLQKPFSFQELKLIIEKAVSDNHSSPQN